MVSESDETRSRGGGDGAASVGEPSLEQVVRNGWLLHDERAATVELTLDFLVGLYDSFVSPENAMYQVGMAWGRTFGARMQAEAQKYRGSLTALPMEDLLMILQDELVRGRWGRVAMDAGRHASKGLVLATLMAGPLAALPEGVSNGFVVLVAGFLAGVVGRCTGMPLEGVGMRFEEDRVVFAEIVVGHEMRIARIREHLSRGKDWAEAISAG